MLDLRPRTPAAEGPRSSQDVDGFEQARLTAAVYAKHDVLHTKLWQTRVRQIAKITCA